METMEAMYRLVREYESKSIIRRVDSNNVNLHVACGKGIIVVINLIEFKTSTGAESCCEQRLDISVNQAQLDEEETTVGILSVVGNLKIQAKEITDDDVEWCARFQDGSLLRFKSKDQSWNSSGSDKKMKKVERMMFLPKKAKEKRMKEMENETVAWDG